MAVSTRKSCPVKLLRNFDCLFTCNEYLAVWIFTPCNSMRDKTLLSDKMRQHTPLSSLNPANSSTVQLRNNLKNADFWAQTNASIKRFLTFFVKVCIDEVPELKSYSTATTLSEFDKWSETRAGSGTGLCPLAPDSTHGYSENMNCHISDLSIRQDHTFSYLQISTNIYNIYNIYKSPLIYVYCSWQWAESGNRN